MDNPDVPFINQNRYNRRQIINRRNQRIQRQRPGINRTSRGRTSTNNNTNTILRQIALTF
ncbi:18037_t:CDS:2 [Rhizophagus irregularis]|nr:18037_t:CDS:2 [Rhizophagus irregularis]